MQAEFLHRDNVLKLNKNRIQTTILFNIKQKNLSSMQIIQTVYFTKQRPPMDQYRKTPCISSVAS